MGVYSAYELSPLEKVRRATIELMAEQPFFAHLAMALILMPIASDDERAKTLKTAGVNARGELFFNEEFIKKVKREQMRGLLAHETLHCLTPDVVVGDEDVEISGVNKGNKMVCADGKLHAADAVKKRFYSGEVVELKAQGMLPFNITKNHRVLRVRMNGWKTCEWKGERWNERILSEKEWVDAGKIKKGDFLIVPKLQGSSNKRMISFKKYVHGNKWSVLPQLMKGVALTEEVAFFIGRFIADGYTDKCKNSSNIGIVFNKRKKADADRILKTIRGEFGVAARLKFDDKKGEGVWRIHAGNPVLRRFLREEVGTYAHNKLIPTWIVNHKDIKIVKAALQGLFGGDGWVSKNVVGFCTVNKSQAIRVQRMLTRINVVGKLYVRNEDHKPVVIFGEQMSDSSRTQYILLASDQEVFELMGHKREFSKRKTYHYIDLGDSFGVKVTSTKRKRYSGDVYNLRTSEENYTANNVVVHNCALNHIGRVGGRNMEIANIAMDMVVNSMVVGSDMVLPDGSIPVDKHKDTSWIETPKGKIVIEKVSERWWEDIYEELVKALDAKGMITWVDGGGAGEGYSGRDTHDHSGTAAGSEELTEAEKEASAGKWRQRLAESAMIAKQQGKLPGGMERLVNELLKPKVNWREQLKRYIKEHVYPNDFTYAKPHKKSGILGVYLPNVKKESMVEVEVLIDTSGSIGGEELKEFLSEAAGIAMSFASVKMTVSFCDTQLYEDARYVIKSGNVKKILDVVPKGGGGTSMESGIDWIKQNSRQTSVVVVLTDGCDSYNRTRKSYPFEVIWCLSKGGVSAEDHAASYGKKISLK